ncbi:FG-GAP repeat domain-containing protein [Paludibaculum fermentans]|uniref:VCBS repeat-containing protein n=1 Tax=Paludibaculum fermentans TaxID=1473598 RepID=A0A7S7NVA1_PALFE|nr:VCBS repeat-containing protein [Paludibaculum fermentans]QOY90373.1 VCBS repeat-containing protein [Paludibaculum fermentans]
MRVLLGSLRFWLLLVVCSVALVLLVRTQGQVARAAQVVLRSFDRVVLLEEKGETSAGVNVGDLNGDGRLDIVLGKGRHWPLFNRVLLNDGQGGFRGSNLGSAPDRTYSAALADLNHDGSLDIVVSNDSPDRKLVYLNDGKGHFAEAGTFGRPTWSTRYVTLADLNGDGYPDIVAANRGDYPDIVAGKRGEGPQTPVPSFVCLNDGKAHFPACDALPTESATSIVAADFDGDGALDLFVPHRDGGQSLVLWGDGQGHFPTSTKVGPAAMWIRMGAAGDLDGDGRLDLAIIEERQRMAFVLFNRGQRRFGELEPLPGPPRPPYALAVVDLNRDGRPDIVVGHVEMPGSVYFNTGQGHRFQEVPWNDGKGTVYGLAFADFDGDGWPDIVAARSDAPNGIWFSGGPKTGR